MRRLSDRAGLTSSLAERGSEVSSWSTPSRLWQKLKPLVREKRYAPTPAEEHLWGYLRNKQLSGYKFRRQHPIDRFIIDFYCAEAQLVIEVDGSIHDNTQEQDALRQEFLENRDLSVLRFSNASVFDSIENVLAEIQSALSLRRSRQ
jgi:very-short-patch-repair endonuclease